MGDPLYVAGLSYDVGTCAAGGVSEASHEISTSQLIIFQFDARPSGFSCPSAAKIKSYCDATDPYCCNGDDAATHEGYGAEYGSAAYSFVQSKLTGMLLEVRV